ncbi:membrane protein, partial [Bacillus paranthracis]
MTCYEMGSIQSYIDGELSREERKQFIKHLDKCKKCQNLLIELTELNQWEHSTLAEEKLHEAPEINIDVEKAWQTFNGYNQTNNVLSTNQTIERKQGVFSNMNKKSKRFMYTSVAAVGIFTIAMIPQVQVAATNIASYFANEVLNDTVVNEGSKDENGVQQEGMLNGQFIPIDEKITDQGITVHFKELYVADARISVHYRVEKADGTLMPF